jgi:hypothetical protein
MSRPERFSDSFTTHEATFSVDVARPFGENTESVIVKIDCDGTVSFDEGVGRGLHASCQTGVSYLRRDSGFGVLSELNTRRWRTISVQLTGSLCRAAARGSYDDLARRFGRIDGPRRSPLDVHRKPRR